MMAVIPPLWKDVDAYLQVTAPPGVATILHYYPAYCFLARIPLYLGYGCESLQAGARWPASHFFAAPVLTNSGVYLLIALQHAALACAELYLITSITKPFSFRLLLAAVLASNPLFYAFAHCVGSEALSVIVLLFFATIGWKIISQATGSARRWLVVALLLCLCLLTRRVNVVLVALLPITFLTSAIVKWSTDRNYSTDFRKAAWALAIGIAALVVANGSVRLMSYAAGLEYRSHLGFTFLWRLKFLASLPVQERNRILDDVAARSKSPDVRKLTSYLHQAISSTSFWSEASTIRDARKLFDSDVHFDYALNRFALAFLLHSDPAFTRAVLHDLKIAGKVRPNDIIAGLLQHTIYFFDHRELMPQCAQLDTFSHNVPDTILRLGNHRYFRSWNMTYRVFFCLWLGVTFAFLSISNRQRSFAVDRAYIVTLTMVGIAIMFVTGAVTVFQVRFTLPMWELTMISSSILLGKLAEIFAMNRTRFLLPREAT
jgi:hypothetical protein